MGAAISWFRPGTVWFFTGAVITGSSNFIKILSSALSLSGAGGHSLSNWPFNVAILSYSLRNSGRYDIKLATSKFMPELKEPNAYCATKLWEADTGLIDWATFIFKIVFSLNSY